MSMILHSLVRLGARFADRVDRQRRVGRPFLTHFLRDAVAAGLLLVAMTCYWVDNTALKVIGTVMFLLIIVHNALSRHWYGLPPGLRLAAQGNVLDLVLMLPLFSMVALVTHGENFTARQLHVLAVYWGVILVAVHLALTWASWVSRRPSKSIQ